MSSSILSYTRSFSTLSLMDGEVTLDPPIRFRSGSHQYIRLIKASFSSQIPNIFSTADGFNNGLIRVSKDAGTNWTSIQLQNGIYTTSMIESAINTSVTSWWTLATDPGFKVRYNLATQIVYVQLDSSKLVAPGQLAIDFSQSKISEVLGYSGTKTFATDGYHEASEYAKLDWAGNSVSILLEGFGPVSIRNGSASTEFCSVPLSAAKNVNEYVYPVGGIVSPIIPITEQKYELRTFRVKFVGSRVEPSGKQYPIYVMEGNCEVQFELRWE